MTEKKLKQFVISKLGKNSTCSADVDYITCDDLIVSDKKEIAHKFVSFFSEIGVTLSKYLGNYSDCSDVNLSYHCNSIFLSPLIVTNLKK